jgi:hypothetical protein
MRNCRWRTAFRLAAGVGIKFLLLKSYLKHWSTVDAGNAVTLSAIGLLVKAIPLCDSQASCSFVGYYYFVFARNKG